MKNNKKFNLIIILSFITYIFVFFFLFLLVEDKNFSEIENRKLGQLPKFTLDGLLSREFGNDFELYVADQFPFRNKFITIKSTSEVVMRKKENNGVYIGKDGHYIEKFEYPDYELMDKLAQYVNDFSENYNTYMMIAPSSLTVLDSKLPNFLDKDIEREAIDDFINRLNSNINNVPITETMKSHEDEYIYYRTDHHWTTLGAYYAYVNLCDKLGIESLDIDNFNIKEVSNKFYGTLFSKGNFMFAKPDVINIFYPKENTDVIVDYVYSNKTTNTLYEMSYLTRKDKYGVFLDNNHPLVKITSTANTGKRIAIIKDSYSHSLIPFLVNHYDEIHVIDLRQFKGSVKQYLSVNKLEDVLFIYSARNIMSDRNIMRLRN